MKQVEIEQSRESSFAKAMEDKSGVGSKQHILRVAVRC